MKFKSKHVLMDDTPGAAGGGDAAPVAQPAQPGSPGEGAGGSQPPQAAPSLLAAAKGEALAAPSPTEFIPEKFRVMNGDTLDIEASARKLAESYSGMEKRFGSGDVPPKSADDYAVTVPEAFKEVWAEDDRFKAFKADAIGAGLTQKQFDFVVGKYFAVVPELVQGAAQLDATKASEELRQVWKSEAEFKTNVGDALKAFEKFADPTDLARIDDIGNNPVVLRILAKVGKELGEASGIPNDSGNTGADNVQDLLKSDAYLNAKHPEHKATSAKVQAFYAKKYGTAPA
jgi:hypothetical protein